MKNTEATTRQASGQLSVGTDSPARRYHFNRFGTYLGYIDGVGHYHDANDIYRGAVSTTGDFFDEHGVYRGWIDVQGQYNDERGAACGYFRPWDDARRASAKPPSQ
jgi:hypothetical protein